MLSVLIAWHLNENIFIKVQILFFTNVIFKYIFFQTFHNKQIEILDIMKTKISIHLSYFVQVKKYHSFANKKNKFTTSSINKWTDKWDKIQEKKVKRLKK